jgi:predicted RNA-binding Zn-ribbon protein involved in translation (DUF1610 family)
MTEETRAWNCGCGARGTVVHPSDASEEESESPFYCARCGEALTDCRRTRRASRLAKPKIARVAPLPRPRELSDDELDRCGQEWERSQEHLGRLGVMAESMWALDWADRLVAEIRRLRSRRT